MRGVHCGDGDRAPCDIGSSPHARGPLAMTDTTDSLTGIIPACAGSTRGVLIMY